MKKLIVSNSIVLGPFEEIEEAEDRYKANGCEFPFGSLGESFKIIELELAENFTSSEYRFEDNKLTKIILGVDKAEIVKLINEIETDANAIIFAVVGNKTVEYQDAYKDAKDFADAGFTGAVPQSVQDWADIKEWTPQQAAEDVIQTGEVWIIASAQIRKHRLACKEAARKASTAEELEAAKAAWEMFKANIKTALGI